MNTNFVARLGLAALVAIAIPACSAAADDTDSSGAAASKKGGAAAKGAKDDAGEVGVEIVVSENDSEAAGNFYWTIIQDFMEYAKNETRNGNHGASTWDEIDQGIYKMAGNDADIVCLFAPGKERSCTFTFDNPVDKELGVPVSGGSSSSLADYFRARGVQVAGFGGGGGNGKGEPASDAFSIGEEKDGIYIVCQSDTPDRGIPTSKCAFFLTGKKK